jgi:hypothetical protein
MDMWERGEWGYPRRPDPSAGESVGIDYIDDVTGVRYDIKGPYSRDALERRIAGDAAARGRPAPAFDPGRRIRGQYDGAEEIAGFRREIAEGNRVVVDTRNLNAADLADLRQRVRDAGIEDQVDWWPPSTR